MIMHPYWLIAASAALAVIPIALAMVTSYMKVSIVLGMLRSGLGTQQVPSGTVIMALSLALTCCIMAPVAGETVDILARNPLPAEVTAPPDLNTLNRYTALLMPWRRFMETHTGEREKRFFKEITDLQLKDQPQTEGENECRPDSLRIILPAFILSELKQAFAMAFVIMIPFLVIDLVVANILVGLGMYMVSPVMVALPLKLLLFVVSDAWLLLARGLINSYSIIPG